MRRLDVVLSDLVGRRRAAGPDHLIESLKSRLAGEPEVLVLSGRTDMRTPRIQNKRRGLLIAGGSFAAAVAIAVPLMWLGGDDDGPVAGGISEATTTAAPATKPTATITIKFDGLGGYRGLVVVSWVLPLNLTEERSAFGGTNSGLINQETFSASDVMHPQDVRYFEIVDGVIATFEPGTYRFVVEAFVPSGEMRYGCERLIEVIKDETLALTISELPPYTRDGFHWTPYVDQLRYPDCPDSVRVERP